MTTPALQPVYHSDGIDFYLIPGFPLYAISQCGKVVSLHKKYLGLIRRTHANPQGYLKISLTAEDGRFVTRSIHRLLGMTFLGASAKDHIDHIDCDKRNNSLANLRLATRHQNSANRKKWNGCSSQYKGVHYDRSSQIFKAQIRHNGRLVRLGRFVREVDAAQAYDAAARQLFGDFANLNFQ